MTNSADIKTGEQYPLEILKASRAINYFYYNNPFLFDENPTTKVPITENDPSTEVRPIKIIRIILPSVLGSNGISIKSLNFLENNSPTIINHGEKQINIIQPYVEEVIPDLHSDRQNLGYKNLLHDKYQAELIENLAELKTIDIVKRGLGITIYLGQTQFSSKEDLPTPDELRLHHKLLLGSILILPRDIFYHISTEGIICQYLRGKSRTTRGLALPKQKLVDLFQAHSGPMTYLPQNSLIPIGPNVPKSIGFDIKNQLNKINPVLIEMVGESD